MLVICRCRLFGLDTAVFWYFIPPAATNKGLQKTPFLPERIFLSVLVAAGPAIRPFPRLCGAGPGGSMPYYDSHSCFFPAFHFSSMSPGAWIRWFHLRLAFVTLSIPSLPHRSAPPVAPVGVSPAPPIMGVVDSSLAGKPSELSGWRGAASLDCWAAWSWGHGMLVVLRWRSPSMPP